MNNARLMRIKFLPATAERPARLRAWLNDGRRITKPITRGTEMTRQANVFAASCANEWQLGWPVYGAKYADSVWVYLCNPTSLDEHVES